MRMIVRACAALIAVLVAVPLLGAASQEFYLNLLRRGVADFNAGRFEAAKEELRIAAFGLVETIDSYQTTHVYLALAADRLGDTEEARRAVGRVQAAQRVQARYATLPLPAEVRSAFDALVQRIAPAVSATLRGNAGAAVVEREIAVEEIAVDPPRGTTTTTIVTPSPAGVKPPTQGQAPSSQPQGQASTPQRQVQAPTSQPQGQSPAPQSQVQASTSQPQVQASTPQRQVQAPTSLPSTSQPQAQTSTSQPQVQTSTSQPQVQAPASQPQGQPATSQPQTQTSTPQRQVQAPTSQPPSQSPTSQSPSQTSTSQPQAQIPTPQRQVPPPAPKPQTPPPARTDLAEGERVLDANDLVTARTIFRQHLDGSPDRPTLLRIAEGLYRARDFSGALVALRRLGELQLSERPYRYYIAVALYETGDYAGAKTELLAALPHIELTPDVERYRAKILGALD